MNIANAVSAEQNLELKLHFYVFLKLGPSQILANAPNNIKQEGWREPPPAMSHYPQCIVPGDSIASYKNYYVEAKSYFAKWTKREVPDWYAARVIAC